MVAKGKQRGSRPRARHLGPELRRPLILDAALPLFARQGYDAVSMQAVADAAAVSKPVLYSCFSSKEELFDQLARREDRRLWEVAESVAPAERAAQLTATDSQQLLHRSLLTVLRAVETMPDSFRVLYVQAYGEDRIARGRAHWHRRMAALVRLRTDLPEREVAVVARLLVALAEMAFHVMLDDPNAWTADELAAFVAGLAIDGLAGRAATDTPSFAQTQPKT